MDGWVSIWLDDSCIDGWMMGLDRCIMGVRMTGRIDRGMDDMSMDGWMDR